MEIKGEEFIKKVQLQQEREELAQRVSEIDELKSSLNSPYIKEEIDEEFKKDDIDDIKLETNEFDDLVLESNKTNEDNKRKYLTLGLVLVILFLLIILMVRIFTDSSSKQEDPFTQEKTNPIVKNTAEDIKADDYQKIINNKLKEEEEKEKERIAEERLNQIEKKISDEALEETIKKIEKKKQVAKPKPKPVKKKVETRKKQKERSIKHLLSSSTPKGYFVQIGAFSKKPSNSYIQKIRRANLKYTVYKVKVKGKLYNKVLIGPYSSRTQAQNNMPRIKEKLRLSSAYIIKY